MAATAVCISRTMGGGGEEVGRLVAGKLGFDYVDEDIVSRAAERGDVTAEDVADAERRQSLLRRVLAELGTGGGAETYGLALSWEATCPTTCARSSGRRSRRRPAGATSSSSLMPRRSRSRARASSGCS